MQHSLNEVKMQLENIYTKRLVLIPYTREIATEILGGRYQLLYDLGISLGTGWPDAAELETVPKILKNLERVNEPSGFESWMIIVRPEMKIIGSTGFKGVPNEEGSIDIGYGIISQEQKKGYAIEAVTALANWALAKNEVNNIDYNIFSFRTEICLFRLPVFLGRLLCFLIVRCNHRYL